MSTSYANDTVVTTLVSGQSLASNFDSAPIRLNEHSRCTVQIVTDSVTDNTGSWAFEASLDGTSWAPLSGLAADLPDLSDADAVYVVPLTDLSFPYLRVSFTAAGGTPDGTCTIKYFRRADR